MIYETNTHQNINVIIFNFFNTKTHGYTPRIKQPAAEKAPRKPCSPSQTE